jgi:hypothetical protein
MKIPVHLFATARLETDDDAEVAIVKPNLRCHIYRTMQDAVMAAAVTGGLAVEVDSEQLKSFLGPDAHKSIYMMTENAAEEYYPATELTGGIDLVLNVPHVYKKNEDGGDYVELTSAEDIAWLDELEAALPEVHFHI